MYVCMYVALRRLFVSRAAIVVVVCCCAIILPFGGGSQFEMVEAGAMSVWENLTRLR